MTMLLSIPSTTATKCERVDYTNIYQ